MLALAKIAIIACLMPGLALAQQPPAAQSTPPQAEPQQPPVAPPSPPAVPRGGFVVVLDPAHGGTDAGARGASGIIEKNVTLALARAVKSQLEAAGIRVILTRGGDDAPSFDDRSAIANAHRECVFVTLHVASTGAPGTARVYFQAASSGPEAKAIADRNAIPWDHAQEPFAAASRQLAEIMQVQIAQKLRGSPEVPAAGAVRQLRTVAALAVAVELSSVSVSDRAKLDASVAPLADAVARAVAAFRQTYRAEAR